MVLNKSDIENYINQQNIPALTDLVPIAIKSPDQFDKTRLSDAIDGILNYWMYDFSCKKGGDPREYPFEEGLKAIHELTQKDVFLKEIEYQLACGDYCRDKNDFAIAQKFFLDVSDRLVKRLDSQPWDNQAYSRLVYTYQCFPTENEKEKLSYFEKALEVIENRFLSTNADFYFVNLDFLYRGPFPLEFESRLAIQRRVFFKPCIRKAYEDSLFALELAASLHHWLRYPHNPLTNEISADFIQIIEAASHCVSNPGNFDLVTTGQIFAQEGARFERIDFLHTAEILFERALKQSSAFSLIHVYIANNKIQEALLAEKSGDLQKAQSLRTWVKERYLQDWRLHQNDLSYLSHATEFLLNSVEADPNNEMSKNILSEIILMALASEKKGDTHYWFPYLHLIQAYLLLSEIEQVKFWFARGYRALNILVENEIKDFHKQLIKNKSSEELLQFVEKIIFHLDNYLDKRFWNGGLSYSDLTKMTLSDLENWIEATSK